MEDSGLLGGRALVTGAAGFIGERVCIGLQREGWRIRAVDAFRDPPRNQAAAERLGRVGIRVAHCDLSVADLNPWLGSADLVIHLAGRPGVRDRDSAGLHRDNVLAVTRLLHALGRTTLTRLVFASTSTVAAAVDAGGGGLTYAGSKRWAERLVAEAPIPSTTLRLFSVYGPGQRQGMAFAAACRSLTSNRPLSIFGDGSQTRDWTYVDDVVEAILAAHTAPTGRYDVGSGEPTSLAYALGLLEEIAGKRLSLNSEAAHPLDPSRTCADPERHLPGWSARVSLADGLSRQWRDHLERSRAARGSATGAGISSTLSLA